VHGIKNRDVAHQPTFKAVAKRILKAIRGCDLVGYNIRGFDLRMLCAEFERAEDVPLLIPLTARRIAQCYEKLGNAKAAEPYNNAVRRIWEHADDSVRQIL
jgi:exonuclease